MNERIQEILRKVAANHYVMAKHINMEELNAELRVDFMTLADFVTESQWVDLKARIPELHESVLVANAKGSVYINHITYLGTWFYEDKSITHWKPLPEAPK